MRVKKGERKIECNPSFTDSALTPPDPCRIKKARYFYSEVGSMKVLASGLVMSLTVLLAAGEAEFLPNAQLTGYGLLAGAEHSRDVSTEALTEVVQSYCVRCHNERRLTGNLSLEAFEVDGAAEWTETTEDMISKLRLNMMPPPGARRPAGDTLLALAQTLEEIMDGAADQHPNPGFRTFQRLNRPEYARSIESLLGLVIDAEDFLPPDTYSDNFDNIADVQTPSSTVIDAYLRAASQISRMAIGDRNATTTQSIYTTPRTRSQLVRLKGAPRGTRGGISVLHNFLADGWYTFDASFYTDLNGPFFGQWARGEELELSIDGERLAMIEVDRFLNEADPTGQTRGTEPMFVRAGQRRVTAAFLRTFDGPQEDVISPVRQSLADLQIGTADGMTILPHLWQFKISGPDRVAGISETASRQRVFSCRPTDSASSRSCAEEIVTRLATEAYRRPLNEVDVSRLMDFYAEGESEGGFEVGVRTALNGILSSVDFIFRLERAPRGVGSGEIYRVEDTAMASRLSFFLWGLPPDAELRAAAERGELSGDDGLERQVDRMLRDSRSEGLSARFFSQWLRLQDLDGVAPEPDTWPQYDATLRDDMRRETELFFTHLLQEDRSVLELFTADYSFLNEGLAELYRVPEVSGDHFRKVTLPNHQRPGILGHGSILVQTSHANRTSPVLRGKWIMEVLLDSPPPPPPPGIPALEETEGSSDGRSLTVKERMTLHRANPVCSSCHQYIDPIGLALENFDVTGEWRINDAGNSVDPSGELWDGTQVTGARELRDALLQYQETLVRAFTKNLMAYALGRRIEYFDQPAIRTITREAAKNDYQLSSFVLGVVKSDAFQMTMSPAAVDDARQGSNQ
jgi:hypothetical protein